MFSTNLTKKTVVLVFMLIGSFYFNANAQKLADKGRLNGTVRNQRNEALVSATIAVKSGSQTTVTNLNGEYELDLDTGSYTIAISYAGYLPQEISNVTITKKEITKVDVILEERVLGEVVVTSARARSAASVSGLFNTQRNSISVMDGISIDLIRKTPDVNVAQSLRRINGVTVLNEKFIVVRGMADRYNSFLLNGAQLPSTESDKKNFSFDLIPNNLIDNIIVSKTASPDLPADFAGGMVQVNTKEIPDKNTFFISAGTGYNFNSTTKDFIRTRIRRSEYFGEADESLNWFNNNERNARSILKIVPPPGSKEVEDIAGLMVKADNWRFRTYNADPMQTYQASVGLRKRFRNRNSIGAFLAGTYRNQWLIEDYFRGSILADSLRGKQYEFSTNMAGLASVVFNSGRSKFISNTIITRNYQHSNNVVSGLNNNNEAVITYGNLIEATTLILTRLEGEHIITGRKIRINWAGDWSEINRDQPDSRFLDYQKTSNLGSPFDSPLPFLPNFYEKNRTSNIGIFSSILNEKRKGASTNITIPFEVREKKQNLKLGYLFNKRDVDFDLSYLRTVSNSIIGSTTFYGLPMYDIFTVDNFKDGLIEFEGAIYSDYIAHSRLHAFYAMLDLNIAPKLHLVGGARAEDYDWVVKRLKTDTIPTREDFKIYPSVNLIYKLSPKSNLRFSYSQTVSRPDFREAADFNFFDFRTNINYVGNSALKNADIYNYDARFEIFPTAEELISASIFYKKFTNPIENINAVVPDAGTLFNYGVNQRSSTNIGFEIDVRKSLGFIARRSGFLKKIFVSGNFCYMSSEVEIDKDAIQTYYYDLVARQNSANPQTVTGGTRKRPLVGLSPYSINGAISYEGKKWGVTGSYNRIGKRVVFSGLSDSTDVYENPRDVLDFQVSGKFFKGHMEIRLSVSDILNQPFVQYMNNYKPRIIPGPRPGEVDPKGYNLNEKYDKIFYEAKRGSSLSLSVSYRW
jgi:TonB-dependent receptor